MADNGSIPARPAPAPPTAVVAEPALAPLRKVPVKVVSPMDRLKAYLKEVPAIRARLVKVTEEQEEMLIRAVASIEGFDHATARINALVKSWEEQNAGQNAPAAPGAVGPDAAAPAPVPVPGAVSVAPRAVVSVSVTPPPPAPAGGEGVKSGG